MLDYWVDQPAEGGGRHRCQVVGGLQSRHGKVHNLVGLDPALVDALEPLQVDDENGGQPPDLKLLHGQLIPKK